MTRPGRPAQDGRRGRARGSGREATATATAAQGARSRDIRFAGASNLLTGTLTVPAETQDPWAAAVFLHGSGPQDRNEDGPGLALHVFDTLAGDLAEAGIASVRYDKRGVGESPGDLLRATVEDLAADARTAVRFVRRLHETAGLPVYLVGHSEGATIALLLGAIEPPPAGLVLLNPSITPMEDVLRLQAAGVQAAIARLPAPERQRLGIPDGFDQRQATEQMIQAVREAPPDQAAMPMGNQTIPVRWFRSHFDLDLGRLLEGIRVPLLAVGAAKDTQVPPHDAEALAARVRAAAAARGEAIDATAVLVPDLTHVLRRTPGMGAAAEYPQLCQQPVDPGLRQLIVRWLTDRRPDAAGQGGGEEDTGAAAGSPPGR